VATCQQLTVAGADPQLDDDGLALHLEAVTALVHRAVATHFDLQGLVALPLGDLLTLADGEGVPAGDVLDLLAGGSPASAMPDDVASRGCWLSAGYDLTAPTLAELSTGVAAEDHVAAPPTPDDTSALRAQLSPGARPAFDERLAEALLCYPVRDDSGGPTAQWPMGLLRRALLHAGGRLADRGELQDPADAIDLLPEEATASLRRQSRLDPDEIAVRRTVRAQQDRAEPPPVLGTPEPPPAADALPPPLRRCLKAMFAYLEALDGRSDDDPPARQEGLRGMGIAGATHTGRCVVARAPEDAFGLLEPGDVLVTWMTTPASLPLLGLAGAVVTEHGGPLSHAALVARETGITTVVGVAAATTALRTGDVVTVDPATGAVTPV
jgi:pyruvate,water dikinase